MDSSSTPLADYFWIAGVDALSYGQKSQRLATNGESHVNRGSSGVPVESTIQEDRALETEDTRQHGTSAALQSLERGDPLQRLAELSEAVSNLSVDARQAAQSRTLDKVSNSNRSSMTIRPIPASDFNGTSSMSDADFDRALVKFASERENFLDELSFSAGTVVDKPPIRRAKVQKIGAEETTGLKSGNGSIRRHLSFRDFNGMKRQPSIGKAASFRTSRRMSNYNSVIPAPAPIESSPNMHPLRRRFEPVLLDRYPPRSMVDETKRRGAFPDYVPMFAFPNDVNIVSADEQPRSSWHGFAMTSGDNSRLYGICVIVWIPLNSTAAAEIERQCENWRRDNMTNEERELAHSLGERLALERAKLSEHLAKLPSAVSGSSIREALEEEISAIEERIGLMTDLLRPVRHGAAAKIDGLTDGETGLWIPRAYGILGRDAGLTGFWKEWLRAVIVPMTHGAILRVPPSSPKIGMWQPLERYVVNLCVEALSPISSKTQVEIAIRELRLFARKEAVNELPGSRNTDLYALFRALSINHILSLFEFALSESRIILLSSHTAMLHLVSKALASLLYPLTWSCIFIPVLPARLLLALDAPCPYIVGIERRYDRIELPEDDFVLVDLDQDTIESTATPFPLPRQQRRKLASLLQLAAPHHNRYGVSVGPPAYAVETYPFDAFSSENAAVFTGKAALSTLSKYASLTSTQFGDVNGPTATAPPSVFNAFLHSKVDQSRQSERPGTDSTSVSSSSNGSPKLSPTAGAFPVNPLPRSESGFTLASTIREKRSAHFDGSPRRSFSYGMERSPTLRRPSMPFSHHSASRSTSTVSIDANSSYRHAPSTYAQSTMAASTVMPYLLMHPVQSGSGVSWVEGHCLTWLILDSTSMCSVCDEKADEGMYQCSGCQIYAHARCAEQICIVCPATFHADQVQAAFVRCFASLFYTYRKYMHSAAAAQRKTGTLYKFQMDDFLKSLPRENAEYIMMLKQTQAFNEFLHERETTRPDDPSIMLFDQIILAKKYRGRHSIFFKSKPGFLQDTREHLWRSAAAMPPSSRFPGDYRVVTSRVPAKLDPILMKEPRVIQGAPRVNTAKARRKPIPSMLGLSAVST